MVISLEPGIAFSVPGMGIPKKSILPRWQIPPTSPVLQTSSEALPTLGGKCHGHVHTLLASAMLTCQHTLTQTPYYHGHAYSNAFEFEADDNNNLRGGLCSIPMRGLFPGPPPRVRSRHRRGGRNHGKLASLVGCLGLRRSTSTSYPAWTTPQKRPI